MTAITSQQLSDAASDAIDLASLVNDGVSPGTVTTRTGRVLKTVAKLEDDAEAGIAAILAAGVTVGLNGAVLFASAFASLAAADAAAAAANVSIFLDNDYTLAGDTTLAAHWVYGGRKITLNGHTLTMTSFFAPARQMFDVSSGGTFVAPVPFPAFAELFGAVGDGTTDDTTALQFTVDWISANGGGTLQGLGKIYVGNIVVKKGVTLRGNAGGYGYDSSNPVPETTFKAAGTGVVVDTESGTGIHGIHLANFNVVGLGAGTPLIGVRMNTGAYWCSARNLHIFDTADQGFYSAPVTNACTFDGILVVGALANQTRSEIAGGTEIHGSDHWISNIESGCGQTALSPNFDMSTPLFTCGTWIDSASDANVSKVSGEAADIGLYTTGSAATYSQCYPNFVFAHGWVDNSGNYTQMVNCKSFNNGRAAADTYDSFYRLSTGGAINVSEFCAYVPGGTNAMRYAINDQGVDSGSNAIRARYAGVRAVGTFTRTYNINAAFAGAEIIISDGPMYILTVGDTTPTVDNWKRFRTANTAPTAITNFDDGVSGQEITVWLKDDFTTIVQGATIKNTSGSDISTQGFYHYLLYNGIWYQQ